MRNNYFQNLKINESTRNLGALRGFTISKSKEQTYQWFISSDGSLELDFVMD